MAGRWDKYAIGGATRPDSFTSMTPAMQKGLWGLMQAADAELGGGLQVYSGYRSPELQGRLYQRALKKYGSPSAARKWVAPPGRSFHNTGQAADLKYKGVRIDQLPKSHPARVWLTKNVGRFGLSRPLAHEPWQVELAGARAGRKAGVPPTAPPVSKPKLTAAAMMSAGVDPGLAHAQAAISGGSGGDLGALLSAAAVGQQTAPSNAGLLDMVSRNGDLANSGDYGVNRIQPRFGVTRGNDGLDKFVAM